MEWIIVLMDFSNESISAWMVAQTYALKNKEKGIRKKILLLNYIDDLSEISFDFKGEHFEKQHSNRYVADQTKQSEKRMQHLQQDSELTGIEVISKVIVSSDKKSLESIHSEGIDLILMGKRHNSPTGAKGAYNTASFVIGERLQEIVKTSSCPILMVKEDAELSDFKNIVLFYSEELSSKSAFIENLKKLQDLFNFKIHILKVNPLLSIHDPELVKSEMDNWAQEQHLNNYTINFRTGAREDDEIFRFALDTQSDIIVLLNKDEIGSPTLLNGSFAEDVLFSNQSVLTIY